MHSAAGPFTTCAVLAMVNVKGTQLIEFYADKKREKGSGKVFHAIARRLLTIIYVMLKRVLNYWSPF
jgi:hypothetical protein